MQASEEELGVSKTVSGFVFPLGATMNMDGTALYEGIAAVFLAYLFGIELSTTAMITVFFMAMVSSIGAPGMPSGSMAGMQMVLLGAGIPLEAIGILLVVERPLDTIRTAVNVEGDMIGALVTQHYLNNSVEAHA
jgi:Na+/H+-dicarboxylate symporter